MQYKTALRANKLGIRIRLSEGSVNGLTNIVFLRKTFFSIEGSMVLQFKENVFPPKVLATATPTFSCATPGRAKTMRFSAMPFNSLHHNPCHDAF